LEAKQSHQCYCAGEGHSSYPLNSASQFICLSSLNSQFNYFNQPVKLTLIAMGYSIPFGILGGGGANLAPRSISFAMQKLRGVLIFLDEE